MTRTPPPEQRDPLREIPSFVNTASGSSRQTSTKLASFRQTSLFDAYPRPSLSSSFASSSPEALFENNRRSGRNDASSSECATSPCKDLGDDEGNHARPTEGQDGGKPSLKKRKVDLGREEARIVSRFDIRMGKRKVPSMDPVQGRQISVFALANRRALGFSTSKAQLSMRPYLRDFVSNNEDDVYRCASSNPIKNFASPFAVAFSRGAKAGGAQIFAVADEEGHVSFINSSENNQYEGARYRASNTFVAHRNAIFDLAWSHDDADIATASGDQTVKLWNTETQQCVGALSGHTCTIKNVVWDPFNKNILATASRDGSIQIWDRRTPGTDLPEVPNGPAPWAPAGTSIGMVNHIRNAHGTKGRQTKGRSATRSVTAIAYLQHSENLLASGGSSDSTIKVWDLRKTQRSKPNPEFVDSNADAAADLVNPRPRGIASMELSPNGRRLYALSTDSKIYAFNALNISQPAPEAVFSHPKATCASFYVRLAVSPCSRYVATASSDHAVYVWDTEGSGQDGVRLLGHDKETSGVDWGKDTLVSCSDDMIVRVWKHAPNTARKARLEKETRYRWSGEDEDE